MESAHVPFDAVNAVAVNHKHGLLRSIVVGVAAAKAIAYSLGVPLIGIHHIEGHIYSNLIQHPEVEFPHICLTVSGGHNLLLYVIDHGKYELLGRTLDDAAGEAFDKVSKLLGLGFPGGPIIDKLARQGNPETIAFPRPMLDKPGYDFSFSGLKTAVTNELRRFKQDNIEFRVSDLVASFQQAVIDVLVAKTLSAAKYKKVSSVTVAGGVSANSLLRERFLQAGEQNGIKFYFPDLALCTDNAAMVAGYAYYKYRSGVRSPFDMDAAANAPLGSLGVTYK
jgi:tRNA N6-adenosine threonylcarbamoyltransferase